MWNLHDKLEHAETEGRSCWVEILWSGEQPFVGKNTKNVNWFLELERSSKNSYKSRIFCSINLSRVEFSWSWQSSRYLKSDNWGSNGERLSKRIWECEVEGKRRRGRLRIRWTKYTTKNGILCDEGSLLTQDTGIKSGYSRTKRQHRTKRFYISNPIAVDLFYTDSYHDLLFPDDLHPSTEEVGTFSHCSSTGSTSTLVLFLDWVLKEYREISKCTLTCLVLDDCWWSCMVG